MKRIAWAKKALSVILCAMLLLAAAAGCASKEPENTAGDGVETSDQPGSQGDVNSAPPEENPGQVDKLVTTLSSASFNTSPFTSSSMGAVMKPLMYATLIYRTYYGAPLEDCQMWLAKSVTKTDDKTYRIELYDYIRDSKGNQIDADDVLFSYEMSRTMANFLTMDTDMESLTKIGPYELEMKVTKTAPGVIENLLSNNLLYIVDQGWYEGASDEERMNDPATTGAYTLKELVSGSSVTFEALDNYWQTDESLRPIGAKQNVKTIVFKVITEPAMRAIGLENKELDIADINSTDLQRFYANNASLDGWNTSIVSSAIGHMAFINMDSGMSPLADSLDLRKAVLYAINSEDVMFASGSPADAASVLHTLGTPVLNGYLSKWDSEEYFDHNADMAKQYLASAGYKPGELTIRVMTSMSLYSDSVRAVLIANLEEAGFKVESVAVEQALFNTYKNDSSQWDVMIDVKSGQLGHIAGTWDYCFNPGGYTNGSVCFTHDDELVKLLERVNSVTDDAAIDAFHRYLKDNAICKGLFTGATIVVAQDGIIEVPIGSNGTTIVPNAVVFGAGYQSVG